MVVHQLERKAESRKQKAKSDYVEYHSGNIRLYLLHNRFLLSAFCFALF
jgi:hypothetical protein